MNMASDEQGQLAKKTREFTGYTRPSNSNMKNVKESVKSSALPLLKRRETVFNAFERGIFSLPSGFYTEKSEGSAELDDNDQTNESKTSIAIIINIIIRFTST